ncbi:MAG: methylated-DNA--[Clostridia bacterium]|nr:methylated-DNA--[protein]-cysteine S-methyltransferase [Clostridia bacterium]
MKRKSDIFPIGNITFTAENNRIVSIEITDEKYNDCDEVLSIAISQLHEYFNGNRKTFDFEIGYTSGTRFQQKIWDLLRSIPYGETVTYGELAAMADCPKGARAIGNAVHNNPLLIVNPCHRVVAANGKIGGFAYGTEMKISLLNLEERYK